jgi:hypothetical protein
MKVFMGIFKSAFLYLTKTIYLFLPIAIIFGLFSGSNTVSNSFISNSTADSGGLISLGSGTVMTVLLSIFFVVIALAVVFLVAWSKKIVIEKSLEAASSLADYLPQKSNFDRRKISGLLVIDLISYVATFSLSFLLLNSSFLIALLTTESNSLLIIFFYILTLCLVIPIILIFNTFVSLTQVDFILGQGRLVDSIKHIFSIIKSRLWGIMGFSLLVSLVQILPVEILSVIIPGGIGSVRLFSGWGIFYGFIVLVVMGYIQILLLSLWKGFYNNLSS